MSSASIDTILRLFVSRMERSADQPAIHFKQGEDYQVRSWNELATDVFRVAAGLVSLGIEPGDRVAQLSENRYEWILADLAIQVAQAVHVPIHAPLAAAQVGYQVGHSGAKVVMVSTPEQASKVASIADSLDDHLEVVTYETPTSSVPQHVTPIQDWLQNDRAAETIVEASLAAGRAEDLATILYTSGTTGEPKGVMLTQANLVTNAQAVIERFQMEEDEIRLSFLPLSHIFARTCDLYTWIGSGAELALAESRETVVADCGLIRPTVLNGVPYFFDRVHRALMRMGLADQPGSLRQLLGGRIKHCGSGGAALPDHLFDFFMQQEVLVLQGYGLTETSPVISVSTTDEYRRGSAGKAITDVDVKIGDDGEILTRGPHIMKGYWQSDADTEEMIRDGWLHTGDLGRVDEDGYIWITGRKKELIVTSAGKNVSPVLLESLLIKDSLIEQAMVIGDDRSYLSALLVPNLEYLRQQLPALSTDLTQDQTLQQPEVQELFARHVEQCLKDVSYHEQVRCFTLLERPFSIEKGEMTPKLSLRRKIIQQHFAAEIERMYEKT